MKHFVYVCLAIGLSIQAIAQKIDAQSVLIREGSKIPAFAQFIEGDEPLETTFVSWFVNNYFPNANVGLQLLSTDRDQIGEKHLRYRQVYKGIPVANTMLMVHVRGGKVRRFNGEIASEIEGSTSPGLTESSALNAALQHIGASVYKWQLLEEEAHLKVEQNDSKATYFPKGEMYFHKGVKGQYVLAYRFDIYAHEPLSRQYVYVDAASGKILAEQERIIHTDAPGSAVTAYSGTQPIVADYTGTTYRLRETGRGNGIETFNLQKGTTYSSAVDFTDADNVWNNVNTNKDQYATDAHFGAEKTYDYFFNKFNRNSIDGNGLKLLSYVHYSTNYVNAFWDGTRMTYGDGNSTYNPLTSVDIAGHEITHGLTDYTANLVYSYESGALNESFSDIFGAAIEFYATPSLADWLVGEDIGAAFRSMSNPNAFSHPDTYLGTYWYSGSGDNGGVHYNSGVQNFWFYLLSVGGSGTNDIGNAYNVSAIGIDKAAAIAFRTLTVYLGPNAQYADARFYSIKAAEDLYGICSPEALAVARAWYAVGIGSNAIVTLPVIISTSGPTTFCQGGSVTLNANVLSNYQWNLNGSPILGATLASYTASSPGNYTCSTNSCGTTYTSPAIAVTVNTAQVSISANQTSACSPITLNSTSTAGYSKQWTLNGTAITGATGDTYTATQSGSYALRIQGTSSSGQTLSNNSVLNIPDNSCSLNASPIAVSGLPTMVNTAGISVRINITHPYVGDLKIWLEAPNGDILGLANGVGGSGDNFVNTVFSDAGAAQIPANGAPYTATYKPWQSSFTQCGTTTNRTSFGAIGNGTINPNGTWRLKVADVYAADIGSLNNWSITFPSTTSPNPDCGPATSNSINLTINTPNNFYIDADNDGVGGSTPQSICASTPPAGYSSITGDCNDNDPTIYAIINYFLDADNDGIGGNTIQGFCSATAPIGYASVNGDCNDNDPTVSTPVTYYVDADGDGYGSSTAMVFCSANPPAGYSANNNDCHDGRAEVYPGSTEICDNSVDDNCNGQQDEGCIIYTYYYDADGDGFGTPLVSAGTYSSTPPQDYVTNSVDCNDGNAAINPNAIEVCNGIDDNCNGLSDENTPLLTAPTVVNGPAGVCKSQTGVVFSVSTVAWATNYNWTVPAGATITSGQGTTSITVNFSSTQAAGSVCVTASNACRTASSVCRSLIIYTVKPVTPTAILGSNIEACPGTTRTFSVATVTNATSYNWTLPANSSITSGQGTTSVVVSFGAAFTGGTLSVTASNCIGTSTARTLTLYVKPGTPASITGPVNGVCGGSTTTYSCPSVVGATSYNWTVPAGWIVSNGQGTTSAQITAPTSYSSASISVAAVSACGSSTNRTITVRSVPAQPGTISGTSTNLCGGGSFNYSITAVTGATSYQWTPPTGCTITANSGTGITLSIPSNFTTGTLSVRAVNACGLSTARTLSLTRLPATPSTITGATSVCYNAVNQGYAITSTPGLSYTWTVPTGATIVSGQGTNLITVNFGTTGGNITVKANNTCGSSTTRSLAVSVTACRMDENNQAEGREIELQLPVLYPNPGNGMLTIASFRNDLELQMRVFSASGQLVQESIIPAHAENCTLDLMHLASGLYLIRLESVSGIDELRYIKE